MQPTPAHLLSPPRPARAALAGAALSLLLAACGGGGGSSSAGGTTQAAPTASTTPVTPQPVVVSISATPTATTTGQLISLSWSAANADSCTASGAWSGTLAGSGTRSVTAGAAGTATYTLTCGGVGNSASVAVSAPEPLPTVSLALAPANISTTQTAQLSWSSANATACSASGAWSGAKAVAGSAGVGQNSPGSYTYTLTCSGAGGSATGSATLGVSAGPGNTATLVVDNGPAGAKGAINVPYVSVTVCRPGSALCQTIDHVLVDTGSYGLRLLAPLDAALALPAVSTPSGADAGECGKFVSGYTWGAVRRADVKIAGETAAGVSIQVIGDTDANFASVPAGCSSAGNNLGSLAKLGAKGILGIGLLRQDCGASCARGAVGGTYYACAGGACAASAMPLAAQVSNPVASFASDNNGVLMLLPAVGNAGATSLSGTLVFGVDTQANNALGGETVYQANGSANFNTSYKGRNYSASFIDSGSNGIFFNDGTLRACAQNSGFYCPLSPLTLNASNSAYDGGSSGALTFNVVNLEGLAGSVSAAPLGGVLSNSAGSLGNSFDWGLPFFYGRRVFVVLEDASTTAGNGPYWAY